MTFAQRVAIAALTFGLSTAACTSAFAAVTHYNVFEFTGSADGKESDFNNWYTKKHIPAVLKVPGVKSVQRYRVDMAQRPGTAISPYYLLISLDTSDLKATSDKLSALLAQGSAYEDAASTVTAYYLPMPILMAKDVTGTTPAPAIPGKTQLRTFHLLAMVNGDLTHEQEFNDSYSSTHFQDVIRNPGVVWGQRSKLAMVAPEGYAWANYLADYQYSAYDVNKANDEVNRRLAEHITRPILFTAKGAKGGHTWYSEAIGPVLHAH